MCDSIDFAGSEELVEFGGDFGRVHHAEGAEGGGGSGTTPFGAGEAARAESAERNAGCYECL